MLRLLVAEDDPQIQRLLGVIFKNNGFEVTSALDGQEAIDRLQSGRFDGMVLDLMMPRVNGIEVVRFLQNQMPEMVKKTVIATAFSELATQHGLNDVCAVVPKPFDVQQLVSTVRGCTSTDGAHRI